MRTITTEQQAVLSGSTRRNRLKVEVAPSSANFIGNVGITDLTNLVLGGITYNFVKDVSYKDGVDDTSMTAEITIARNIFDYNTSPLVTSSSLNVGGAIISLNYCVRISAAVVPEGVSPVASDYNVIFFGRVYQTDWSGTNDYKLSCHDYCGELLSYWYYNRATSYGLVGGGGTIIETIMQQILTTVARSQATDNATSFVTTQPFLNQLFSKNGSVGTPFNPADSPGAQALFFTQDQMPTFTALQQFSNNIGWCLKQRWQTNAAAFKLQLFDPVRTNNVSTFTFSASQYFDVAQIGLQLSEIRNLVAIPYTDNTGTAAVYISPTPATPNAAAVASQVAYGIQFMQIAPEATLNTYLSADAANLAARALSDLASPQITISLKVPYFWPIEVCDVYTIKANGKHFDSDQVLAVVSFEHSCPHDGQWSTTINFRGKPTGGVKTWFDRQASFTRKKFGTFNNVTQPLNGSPNSNFGQNTLF